MLPDLRLGVQPSARVVEIGLALAVESRVLARPQLFDGVAVPFGVLDGGPTDRERRVARGGDRRAMR